MIKAVIFDFFGVLAMKDTSSFRKAHLSGDPAKNARAGKLNDELARGRLGYDEFIDKLAELGGVERGKVLAYTEDYRPNQELLGYIRRRLKPKYKVGIISNAGADWVLQILGSENLKLFDDVILSYQVKFIKPEAQIYQLSAKNLGVIPQQCVFIDDIQTYCHGAEGAGMKSIWYKDSTQLETQLDKLLAAHSNK